MNVKQSNPEGFTLIELMVYLSISTIAILVFTNFMADVTQNAAKSKVTKEVQQNARLILTKITQEIRTSQGIDMGQSVLNSDDGKLVIIRAGGSTTFDLVSGDVTIDTGAGSEVLTSNHVKVTELHFTETQNAISVDITVEQKRDTDRTHERDSITLSSTVVPRSTIY